MAMDDRVIEAAANALPQGRTNWNRDRVPDHWSVEMAEAEAAITAALRAMEPELRAAVERLQEAGCAFGYKPNIENIQVMNAARRDLFALLGLDGDA